MTDITEDAIPTNIAVATTAVMRAVRRLKKADNNAFAKYRYTSVDDFKDALRPLLAANGLTPHADEQACDTFEKPDDKGKPSIHAKYRFSLWLEHISGEAGRPEGLTVMLPYVGAQTTGAARSYAVKEWLKSKFLASSGDSEDADQHDTTEELSKADARPIYTELQEELRLATQDGDVSMRAWAERRRPSIDVLPKDWRLLLQRQYKEGLAIGRAAAAQQNVFDPEAFLANLFADMTDAKTPDLIEEVWDTYDVERTLSDFEDKLQDAFDMKRDRLEKIEA